MNDNAIDYDDSTHTYTVGGRVVPHVTGILAPLTNYSHIPPDRLEIARQRGKAVHAMVELDVRGDLDEAALPEWMRPVFAIWRKFSSESGIEVISSERRVYHKQYRFAGTYDLKCTMRGQKGVGIVDVKRSFMAGPVIGYQTAAYAEADEDKIQWRAALRLHEDKPYKLELYDDKNDFQRFLLCLAFYRLKEKLK